MQGSVHAGAGACRGRCKTRCKGQCMQGSVPESVLSSMLRPGSGYCAPAPQLLQCMPNSIDRLPASAFVAAPHFACLMLQRLAWCSKPQTPTRLTLDVSISAAALTTLSPLSLCGDARSGSRITYKEEAARRRRAVTQPGRSPADAHVSGATFAPVAVLMYRPMRYQNMLMYRQCGTIT